MKFIKITMLTFALVASTATLAQSREELCHNAAESDIAIKRSLQKDPSSFAGFLRYIDEVEKNPRMKAALRDRLSGFITVVVFQKENSLDFRLCGACCNNP